MHYKQAVPSWLELLCLDRLVPENKGCAVFTIETPQLIHLNTASRLGWTTYISPLWEPQISKNYRRWQRAPTFHVLPSVKIVGSLWRQQRLRHLWAKFITMWQQTANISALVQSLSHDIWGIEDIVPRCLSSILASHTSYITPGTHWQVSSGPQSHSGYAWYDSYSTMLLLPHTPFTEWYL